MCWEDDDWGYKKKKKYDKYYDDEEEEDGWGWKRKYKKKKMRKPGCECGSQEVLSANNPEQPSRLSAKFDLIANKNYESIEVSSYLRYGILAEEPFPDTSADFDDLLVDDRYQPVQGNIVINNNNANNILDFPVGGDMYF